MVSIDRVYQTVLSIVNREGFSYVTPQEFNLLANQAQIEIFEEYFQDQARAEATYNSDSDYSDAIKNLDEKMVIFETSADLMEDANTNNVFSDPDNLYRLGTVFLNNVIADMVSHKQAAYIRLSPLTSPTKTQPVYIRTGSGFRLLFSQTDATMMTEDDVVRIEYLRRPAEVQWRGVPMNGQFVQSGSVDFELHPSEFPELVVTILGYIGILVNRQDVLAYAQAKETAIEQNEQ